MMGKTLAVLGLIVVTSLFCCGHIFPKHEYVDYTYRETLLKGETIDGVAEKYFEENQDGRTWEEFRYDAREMNSKLTANGRAPQIGDKVVVTIRKEVRK